MAPRCVSNSDSFRLTVASGVLSRRAAAERLPASATAKAIDIPSRRSIQCFHFLEEYFPILPDSDLFRKASCCSSAFNTAHKKETNMSTTTAQGAALITGASTGIGAVYADRLAKRGFDLILVARNKQRLASLARRVSQETGRTIETVSADLTNTADLHRVEGMLRSSASVSMLVNNAGIAAVAPPVASDVDKMDDMIRLNVTALTRLTYAAAPGFVARGGGAIINVASIVAIAPELLNGVYGATKAYVL